MKKSCIFVICALVLFAIVEPKPYRGDRNDDGDDEQGEASGGYGSSNAVQRGDNDGNGGTNGGQGYGGRGDRGDRGDAYSDYDYSAIYRQRPCRGRGCKNNYVGNGRHNTNTVYMYD